MTNTETTETTETIGMPQQDVHWGDTAFGENAGMGIMIFGFAAVVFALSKVF